MTITLDINNDMEELLRQEVEVFFLHVLREALEKMLPDPSVNPPRIAGLNAGQIWVSEDFDALLPDTFWTGEMTETNIC